MKPLELPKTLLNASHFAHLPVGLAQRMHIMTEQIGNDKKVQVTMTCHHHHSPWYWYLINMLMMMEIDMVWVGQEWA
jgi:hypothetical protein